MGWIVGLTLLAAGLTPVGAPAPATAATSVAAVRATSAAASAPLGSARPISIAVDSRGTSYVGYARGGALARVTDAGKRRSTVAIDQDGPVIGLEADSRDRVWVVDNDSITRLRSDGTLLRRIDRVAPDMCADDAKSSSRVFGGLAVGPSALYVASRCSAVVEVYDKSSGDGVAQVRLPGGQRARGLAYGRTTGGKTGRLFVAVPGAAAVLTYAADNLRDGSSPARRTAITRPGRGKKPTPTGLAVDGAGNLTVSDARNHAIYLYSTGNRYQRYRVLGHPARAGSSDGYLDAPADLAQHARDGGGLSGNLFIADTRNGRVQRWDSGGGYTFWATELRAPTPGTGEPDEPTDPDPPSTTGAPRNTTPPRITDSAASTDGSPLVCNPGTWTGGTASYAYRWLRDGVVRPGVSGSSYDLVAADDGTEITCRVTATNAVGSTSVTSDPWYVGTPTAPVSATPPTITGTPKRDNTLLCSTGSWTGTPSPRFSYVWLRDSVQVADTPSYRVRSADLGASLSCTVIATNQAGSASATSAAVVPEGVGSGEDPTAGPCAGTPRVQIAGGAARTGSASVTLRVVAPVDATGIEASNAASFAAARPLALSASCTAAWTLAAPASDSTPATVYVRWVGGTSAGQVVSDRIRFDRTAPRVTSAKVRYAKRKWRLRVRASDVSSLATVQYASGRTNHGTTTRYRKNLKVASPGTARWVRVTDRFGNRGGWVRTS